MQEHSATHADGAILTLQARDRWGRPTGESRSWNLTSGDVLLVDQDYGGDTHRMIIGIEQAAFNVITDTVLASGNGQRQLESHAYAEDKRRWRESHVR